MVKRRRNTVREAILRLMTVVGLKDAPSDNALGNNGLLSLVSSDLTFRS